MRLVRSDIFETNSSSTHAIVVPNHVDSNQCMLLSSESTEYYFGREQYRLVEYWDEKLAYVYLVLKGLEDYQWDKEFPKITTKQLTKFKETVNAIYQQISARQFYQHGTTFLNDDRKPDDVFDCIDKDNNTNYFVDHHGLFAREEHLREFINRVLNDYEFLKKFLFCKDSYITIGGDEYNGFYIKTIGFEYDYDYDKYEQYHVNEKGERCPSRDSFPHTEAGWNQYWETQKKYPILRDNGGFWDRLAEYEKDNDVYLKGN